MKLFLFWVVVVLVASMAKKKKHRHKIINHTLPTEQQNYTVPLHPTPSLRSMRMTKPHSKKAQLNLLRQQQQMLHDMKQEEQAQEYKDKEQAQEYKDRLLRIIEQHGPHLTTGSTSYQNLITKIYQVMHNESIYQNETLQDVAAVGALLYTLGHSDN